MNHPSGIVTGIGKGIGLETTKFLLKKKFNIIGITRSDNLSLKKLKNKFNKSFEYYVYDLSNIQGIENLIKKICKKKKLSFLVNNAGTRCRKKFLTSSYDLLDQVMKTNFYSPLTLTKNFLKYSKSKKKNIVMITSIVGNFGFDELTNYASSKGALESLTKSLAVEYAQKNVRINSIAPGFIESSYYPKFKKNKKLYKWTLSKIPMKRWGKCEEISPMIELLISNKSSYITGSTIYIDGGWNA